MAVDLVVPSMGESIAEVEIGAWRKQPGELVARDEAVVTLESDKATVELPAPVAGRLVQALKPRGARATIGEVIGSIEPTAHPAAQDAPAATRAASAPAPAAAPSRAQVAASDAHVMPAAERALAHAGLSAEQVQATGPGGRLLKEDVQRQLARASSLTEGPLTTLGSPGLRGERSEELVPVSAIRRRIAERLVHAKQSMAMLTTFNEIDMTQVGALRRQYGEAFQARHGIKLGLMSFFVRAAIDALRAFPQLNSELRGEDLVYRNYCDIGIAVGGGRGLVVPVLRNAELMGFAALERAIADFGRRAKDNMIQLDELQGGTFTITNGGVYGSLLATPIINPPQVAILGMHTIQERPVARDGQVVIRPMMYVALSYDHRVVDGRESVGFLMRIKQLIEDPTRALLET